MKCWHCEAEYEKPIVPDCWATHSSKAIWCNKCRKYMMECQIAWNKAHGLKVNGDPPGEVKTFKDNWTEYHRKRGDYPQSPGVTHKEINE